MAARALLILAVLAVTVWASRAAACVPQPYVLVKPAASGPGGAKVEVVGENFGPSTAEVRWNAVDGQLLGKATGPSFSTEVVVPDEAAPGLYTLVVVLRGAQGEVLDNTRAPFQVTGAGEVPSPPTSAPSPAASSGGDPGSSGAAPALLAGSGIAFAAVFAGMTIGRSRERRRASLPATHAPSPS